MNNIELRDAWFEMTGRLKTGDRINGVVVELQRFGAFLDINEEFRALVEVPNIMKNQKFDIKISHPSDYFTIGDLVSGEILGFAFNNDESIKFSYIWISVKLEDIESP